MLAVAVPERPVIEGDDEARFRALYKEWAPYVLAYAVRRLPSRTEAEEVLAETFAICWRRLPAVPSGTAALPWLYGVAAKVLANHRRSDQRRVRLLDRLRSQELAGGRAPAPLSPALDRLDAALERLRHDDRELLRLAAWEDLRPAEIAEVLGISANAAAVRLHRARRALREAFEQAESGEGDAP